MLPDFLLQAAKEVQAALRTHDEKLVLAESCTGGLVATLMTSLPGISDYFCGSAIVYRWDTKMKWLGVQPETLEKYTDVSRETARELALGVLKQTPEATWAASITGHLGPNAPSHQDGLICIGIAHRSSNDFNSPPEIQTIESFQCDALIAEFPFKADSTPELSLRQQRQLAAARQMLKLISAALER
ncbi:CinA family protein [Gimesia aquarii]|uniref:Nicotinamide-nucleotide amidohydrolase PncC n=1 Tax=Gimesia aquarii TaxID=2527964 RepID=A0A517WTP3_9PLAN|nr:nicotinamide-nucleotide amidohydrolase family protein [Gimesia aquarii]QDU08621.1 Nicotinamide-nucleotide amidohydrolase PncC [Gimesia aquarii]